MEGRHNRSTRLQFSLKKFWQVHWPMSIITSPRLLRDGHKSYWTSKEAALGNISGFEHTDTGAFDQWHSAVGDLQKTYSHDHPKALCGLLTSLLTPPPAYTYILYSSHTGLASPWRHWACSYCRTSAHVTVAECSSPGFRCGLLLHFLHIFTQIPLSQWSLPWPHYLKF